jgi:hypothetical protein
MTKPSTHRSPEHSNRSPSQANKRIFSLVRHGQVAGPAALYGHSDIALSHAGQTTLQQCLNMLHAALPCAALLSSPLIRCAAVAQSFARAHELRLQFEPELREMNFGQWDGIAFDAMATAGILLATTGAGYTAAGRNLATVSKARSSRVGAHVRTQPWRTPTSDLPRRCYTHHSCAYFGLGLHQPPAISTTAPRLHQPQPHRTRQPSPSATAGKVDRRAVITYLIFTNH